MNLVGFTHWIFIFYELFYPIIFKNYLFDNIYIVVFVLKFISWLLLNNECMISLIFKQYINSNYKPGNDIHDLTDMKNTSPFLTKIFQNFIIIIFIFICILICIVSQRSNILDINLLIILILIYVIYILYIRKFYNKEIYDKLKLDNFFIYFKYICIIISVYILFKIFTNIYKYLQK